MNYRLYYTLPDGEEVSAEVLPIESIPDNDRYFYAVRNEKPFCFIKLRNPSEDSGERQEAEKLLDAVNSSYVTSFADGLMENLRLVCPEEKRTVPATDFLLLEYLPYNLEQFRERMRERISPQQQEQYRGQILLKLVEGAGHLHRRGAYNRDIKPQNIMVCARTGRIDVRITDMDAAHNARNQNALRAGTPPFTPRFALQTANLQASIWRDLYAICMVAFWMYGASEVSLYELEDLRSTQSDFGERAKNILSKSGATFPDGLLDILISSLSEAFYGFSFLKSPFPNAQKEQELELNRLGKLRDELQTYYKEPLPELISPYKLSRRWYALLKIDEDYRPVFGMDREYRALSIIAPLGDSRIESLVVGQGRSYAYSPSFYMGNELPPNNDPPELYVSCVCTVGTHPFIQAELYGNSGRLATSAPLLGKVNRVFYSHRDGSIAPALLKEVRACAAGFYDNYGLNIPCRLPTREPVRRVDSSNKPNINIVFLLERPSPDEMKKNCRTAALGSRLIGQIMSLIQDDLIPLGCRPCYYGARSTDRGGVKSFCGGRLNPPPCNVLSEYYTQNASDSYDRSWSGPKRGDRFDFCPELPTVVFGFMRTPVNAWCKIRDFLNALPLGVNRTGFQYAVDYLQLFFLRQEGFIEQAEPWLPCLDAMVGAEGNCLVTPLEDGETPDPCARWLPIIRCLLR